MELILWRHAEAQPWVEGGDDLARRLTAVGERQARRMGQWLQQRLPQTTRIWVSPAARAQGTAAALERPFRTVPELAPELDLMPLLARAGWPQAPAPLLLVGHQPALGQLAAQLLGGSAQAWPVKKAAVWWLSSRQRDGVPQVLMRAVQGVDLL